MVSLSLIPEDKVKSGKRKEVHQLRLEKTIHKQLQMFWENVEVDVRPLILPKRLNLRLYDSVIIIYPQ